MATFDDTRRDWGARPPTKPNTTVPHKARTRRVWHWAGNPTRLHGKGHDACLALVKSWQAYHQNSNGWKDIGYNALVCVHARAIEGRGLAYSGSHSPSWNTTGWGVQYMVGTGEQVTVAMFDRGQTLAADLERLAGHDLTDNSHRDDPKASTECAGAQVTAWVRAGGPEKPTTTPGEDDDMPTADEVAKAVWKQQLPKVGQSTTQAASGQLANAHIYAYRNNVILTSMAAKLDPAELAASLAPLLADALPAGQVSTGQLVDALTQVLGSVNDPAPPP